MNALVNCLRFCYVRHLSVLVSAFEMSMYEKYEYVDFDDYQWCTYHI